jgi:hypothetical protein
MDNYTKLFTLLAYVIHSRIHHQPAGAQSFTPPPPISWRLTGLASLAGAANWGLA